MWRKPKMIKLRNKADADEFLSYEIEQWDEFAEKYYLPKELSWETVKVEFVLWKKKRKIYIVSTCLKNSEKTMFYKIHPSSIGFKYFEDDEWEYISPKVKNQKQ